jgi:hypothetical protein
VLAAVLLAAAAVTGWLLWPAGHPAAANTVTCPDFDPQATPNGSSADLSTLVPGQPTGAVMCRYYGQADAPSRPRTLANSATIDANEAATLAAAFNSGRPGPAGIFNCPRDDDSSIRVYYSYQGGRTVVLSVRRTGCQLARNGVTGRYVSDSVRQELADLVG